MNKTEIKKLIIKTIKDYAIHERKSNELLELVVEKLKPKESHLLNKKIANFLQKELGTDYLVTWDNKIPSLKYINIQIMNRDKMEGHNPYNLENGYRLFFGYDHTEKYYAGEAGKQYSGLRYFSLSYGAASIERAIKCEKFLADKTKIETLTNAYHNLIVAKNILKDPDYKDYYLPAEYNIHKALGLQDFKL